MVNTDILIELVKEMNQESPLDFGLIPVAESEIYQTIASSLVAKFKNDIQSMDTDTRELVYLSSMLHLLLENFVLQYNLLSREHQIDVNALLSKYK